MADEHEHTELVTLDDAHVAQLFPPLTRQEVLNCMFSSWYPKLSKVSFKSKIIKPVEPSFVEYLLSDGFVLPDDAGPASYGNKFEEDSSDEASEWSDDGEEEAKLTVDVSSTVEEIRKAIEELGGKVFPRMNWSAPTDASWMSADNTLQCQTPSEVFALLKGSDKVVGDADKGRYLDQQTLGHWEPELVLKQWCNLLPSMEFRGFVRNGQLIGISQIDMQHYEFLEDMAAEIETEIKHLFDKHVCNAIESQNYCFDVYVTQDSTRAYVVDIEPWTQSVDTILFGWAELLTLAESKQLGLRLFPAGVDPMRYHSRKYSKNVFPTEMTLDAFQEALAKFSFNRQSETAAAAGAASDADSSGE
ncbi:hypothetical protein GGI07_002890 [Coemansia sp. Benny D115]|nr:hypothetical protein GGI07_002890 [Coemansia sp. Benny D115]